MIFKLISIIIYGFIIGLIAKVLHKGDDPKGFLATVLIGVFGSFLGCGIQYLFVGTFAGSGFSYWIFAITGAIILLLINRKIEIRNKNKNEN